MTRLELLRATERETLKFRLLVLLVVSASVLLQLREVPILPIVALVGAYLGYSAALRTVLIPRSHDYRRLLGVMLAVDAATVLATIHLIGADTPAIILLPIGVVYFGLYQGYVSALLMALAVSFGLVGIAALSERIREMADVIAIHVPSSFLLALLIGYLAEARARENEERRSYQQVIQAEAQGRRLLEIAASMGQQTWEALGPESLARAAAETAGLPWAALVYGRADAPNTVHLLGATYKPRTLSPSQGEGASPRLRDTMLGGGEAETQGEDAVEALLPTSWLPSEGKPVYMWTCSVSTELLYALVVLGPAGHPILDDSAKRALRALAPLMARVLEAQGLFQQAERRSREVVGALKATVESAGRLTETQVKRPLRFGALSIEPQRERVRLGQATVHLSPTEFDLLYTLAANAGNVINTETLLRAVWGPDYVPQGKPVDVAVHRLRRKLGALPDGARVIRTVRGRGYAFVAPDTATSA
jgi:DNA-binding winged helix-turn-helix (wHTH) protein